MERSSNIDFIYVTSGLEVSFRVLCKVPVKCVFDWDFGDDTDQVFNKRHVSHSYKSAGFYTVTLHVTSSTGLDEVIQKTVVICDYGHTTLSDSIYVLIDNYIPSEITEGMTREEKAIYIQKWQYYIGPLVNHLIPPDKYLDELWYEALENQLIMELASWDYLNVKIQNLMISTGEYLSQLTSTKETTGDGESGPEKARGDRIKQITTGPTEVQYYDILSDSISSLWDKYSSSMKPGGFMDELRKNLCMLAARLEIYLPFCNTITREVVPRVVNHRRQGPIDGPNPTAPINKASKSSSLLK